MCLLTGCNNARFEDAQAVRDERIRGLFARIEPRHEQGIDNIHKLCDLHRYLEVNREDHLHRTVDFVESREEQRMDAWCEGSDSRQLRCLFFCGHTERIPDTFAKMFY
jgi:hypothetical protein